MWNPQKINLATYYHNHNIEWHIMYVYDELEILTIYMGNKQKDVIIIIIIIYLYIIHVSNCLSIDKFSLSMFWCQNVWNIN